MEKKTFKERFRELYDDHSGCSSISQFAKRLDMNRQSVDRYYNGERCPDAQALKQICEKMNISADWLLGLSPVRSTSVDIQNAVVSLGITEEAANSIMEINKMCGDTLSHFLEQSTVALFFHEYKKFIALLDLLDNNQNSKTDFESTNDDGTITLSLNQTVDFLKQQSAAAIRSICDSEAFDRQAKREGIDKDALLRKIAGIVELDPDQNKDYIDRLQFNE